MTLEDVMLLSDQELNEESAFRVMGWKRNDEEYPESFDKYLDANGNKARSYSQWNPSTDMNDAYSLLQSLIPAWTVSIGHNISGWEVGLWTGVKDGDKYVSATHNSFPRAITIASILAKEEQS